MHETDEVAAHAFRIAQAGKLLRLAAEYGVEHPEHLTREQLATALDENGKIRPDPQDYVRPAGMN